MGQESPFQETALYTNEKDRSWLLDRCRILAFVKKVVSGGGNHNIAFLANDS
jgi:hypothetical protein